MKLNITPRKQFEYLSFSNTSHIAILGIVGVVVIPENATRIFQYTQHLLCHPLLGGTIQYGRKNCELADQIEVTILQRQKSRIGTMKFHTARAKLLCYRNSILQEVDTR